MTDDDLFDFLEAAIDRQLCGIDRDAARKRLMEWSVAGRYFANLQTDLESEGFAPLLKSTAD